jgi:hypothetical protein
MAEYAVFGRSGSGSSGAGSGSGSSGSAAAVSVLEVLQASTLFANLDEHLLTKIAGYFETKAYSAGATIVRAGAPAATLGILARGKANLTAVNAVTGEQRVIEELQVGDPFGDVGVLLEAVRSRSSRRRRAQSSRSRRSSSVRFAARFPASATRSRAVSPCGWSRPT